MCRGLLVHWSTDKSHRCAGLIIEVGIPLDRFEAESGKKTCCGDLAWLAFVPTALLGELL